MRRLLFLALLLNSNSVRGKAILRTMFYAPVMIPLVATRREFDLMKAVVDSQAQAVFAEGKVDEAVDLAKAAFDQDQTPASRATTTSRRRCRASCT